MQIEAPVLRWVGHARVEVSAPVSLGSGPQGERRVVPVTGGRVTGAWDGVVLAGGADWQEVHADGSATMKAGTSAHGQGHETTYAMIVADRTGIPVERIHLIQSDTDLVRTGGGTGGWGGGVFS